MRKRKLPFAVIIVGGVIGAVFIAYTMLLGTVVRPAGEVAVTADRVCRMLTHYIDENDNQFPGSEGDLVSLNLLRKHVRVVNGSQHVDYYYNSAPHGPNSPETPHWSRLYRFTSLTIAYGIQMDDITVSQGVLVDTKTGEPVLLVDGPYKTSLGDGSFYQAHSLKLHEAMHTRAQKIEHWD